MTIEATLCGLKKTRPWELALRFAFGGAITVATGLIANAWGPGYAGLFLAFPAILPASLTLVRRHDGWREACCDAKGAALGSLGLVAFGAVVFFGAGALQAPILLAAAAVAWAGVSFTAWWVAFAPKDETP